jgi:hypothetical protein
MSVPARAWRRLGQLGDIRSCELVALDGHLDVERLQVALRLLTPLHPLLTAEAQGRRWRLGARPLTLTQDARPTRCTMQDLLHDVWAQGDHDVVRIELVRDPVNDWLRVLVPHDRTDARSGAQVVADLAALYGALEAQADDPSHPEVRRMAERVDTAPWEPRTLLPIRAAHTWRALRRMADDLLAPASWTHPPDAPRGPSRVAVHTLPDDALATLKRAAATRGTTVHALLVVAAASALGTRRVMDLMTLRPLATADLSLRSDVLVVPWVQALPGSQDDAHAAVRDAVLDMREGGARAELARLSLYERLAGLLPVRIAARLAFRLFTRCDTVLTNPGPVHVELRSFGSTPVRDFVNFPQLTPPARAGLVFTTFRGRLRVLALWDEAARPDGLALVLERLLAGLGLPGPAYCRDVAEPTAGWTVRARIAGS